MEAARSHLSRLYVEQSANWVVEQPGVIDIIVELEGQGVVTFDGHARIIHQPALMGQLLGHSPGEAWECEQKSGECGFGHVYVLRER